MIAIDVHLDTDAAAAMAKDVREGLAASPKELSPKYFYDERGSQLFERITELPEYYPTRREREILRDRGGEVLAAAGTPGTLVELGSGSASKTRHAAAMLRPANTQNSTSLAVTAGRSRRRRRSRGQRGSAPPTRTPRIVRSARAQAGDGWRPAP